MRLNTPITDETIRTLKAGDSILLSGQIYTARDAAHLRMITALEDKVPAPFSYHGNPVFYAGPAATPPGKPIGSIGPTTAERMDLYAPKLMHAGLKIMIAKGERSPEVIQAIKDTGGIYFIAVAGVAALMSRCVKHAEIIAYDDLGTEAIRKLTVEDFPLIVAIDYLGNNVY